MLRRIFLKTLNIQDIGTTKFLTKIWPKSVLVKQHKKNTALLLSAIIIQAFLKVTEVTTAI